MACRASRQQQGGDIRTGDEQHDADRKRQHPECRPARRDGLLFDGFNIETARALRKWLRERTGSRFWSQRLADHIGFVRRDPSQDAVAEPSDHGARSRP
jgi:hypothetical protein